jgi:hypothetical protein
MPNRHSRRAAAAKARRTALSAFGLAPGKVTHVTYLHDHDCAFENGRCTCTPDITHRTDNRLQRIGPNGRGPADAGEVEETILL